MSAPNTDPKKETKRHKGPLAGFALVVGFVLVLFAGYSIIVAMRANEPGDGEPIRAEEAEVDSPVEPGSEGEGVIDIPPAGDDGAAVEVE